MTSMNPASAAAEAPAPEPAPGPGPRKQPARTSPAPPRTTTPPVGRDGPQVWRLAYWVPDVRWAHPAEATMWLFTFAVFADVPEFRIPPLALALLAPIVAAVGVGRAHRAFPEHEYGTGVRTSMSALAVTAAVAAGGWLVYACGWSTPLRAAGWLALGLVVFGGWYWVLRSTAPTVAEHVADEQEAAREEARLARAESAWEDILAAAGLALRVVEIRTTRAGYVLGVEAANDKKPVSFLTLQNALPDLTTKASALLAHDGVTVSAGTIRVEETEAAHVHLIHVCTAQILRESIAFEPFDQAPATIADPCVFALYEDGQETAVTFGGKEGGVNGKVVGATGSGKSIATNAMIGRIGECGDVLVGVVASEKLVPLVYPWLKPWLEGRTDKPALDFIAGQDPDDVLLMLAGIYQEVCRRNDNLANTATHVPTPEDPAIVCFVEEAAKMAASNATVTLHTGRDVGFSELVHLILGVCRAAQVSLILLNQTDIYGSLGAFGAEIARNTPFRVCLKTLAPQDGQSVLPGLKASYSDTSKLRHKSMLVQPNIEDPRVMPAKAFFLEEDLIHPIAERNGTWRPDLAPEGVELLGEVWTGRWDAARLPELAAAANKDGLVWPGGGAVDVGTQDRDDVVVDERDQELWAMIEAERDSDSTGDSTGDSPSSGTGGEAPAQEAPPVDGVPQLPDIDNDIAELREISNRPPITLPEPLHSVMALLREPEAPADFISTRRLAILLGRVDHDADDAAVNAAAVELGREMSEIDPEIRTEQKRGSGSRSRGYDIPKLKQIAARIAREQGGGR